MKQTYKRIGLCSVILFFFLNLRAQQVLEIPPGSLLKDLAIGDSVVYYQCHVEEAKKLLTTASGQTLSSKYQNYSITEKFVIIRKAEGYTAKYFTSALNVFPNRKFSGLKIREKKYWAFEQQRAFELTEHDIKVFLAMEKKGNEAIEYDFEINKYNTNQLIIKQRKNFKQLVIEGDYVLSRLLKT